MSLLSSQAYIVAWTNRVAHVQQQRLRSASSHPSAPGIPFVQEVGSRPVGTTGAQEYIWNGW